MIAPRKNHLEHNPHHDHGVDHHEARHGPVGAPVLIGPRKRLRPGVTARHVEEGDEGLGALWRENCVRTLYGGSA